MIRKPRSIIVLSFLFIFSPFFITYLKFFLYKIPFSRIDYLILFIYLLSGFFFYLFNKITLWILFLSAFIVIIINYVGIINYSVSLIIIIIIINFLLFGSAIFFLKKHINEPYFKTKLRWWKDDHRHKIDIYLKFLDLNKNVIISDISTGGCFVYLDFKIDSEAEFPILIVSGSFHIKLKAKIMRIVKESDYYFGYGLMFIITDEIEKNGLLALIKKLQKISNYEDEESDLNDKRHFSRFFIGNNLFIESDNNQSPVSLIDISKNGCTIYSDIELDNKLNCFFCFLIDKTSYRIYSKIIWKRGESGEKLYGLKFIKENKFEKAGLKKLIINASIIGTHKKETEIYIQDHY